MTKKMLIDATHEEETRVAIVDNGVLEEFDYESMVRKQIKGGIYLAKVTRVEPSLQAAFVNYGGNRHGFLPFSEIHPDYFRIPISDREALLEEQKAEFDRHNNFDDEEEDEILEGGDSDNDDVDEDIDDEDEEEAVVEVGGADKPADEDDTDLVDKKKTKKSSKKSAKKSKKKAVEAESEESVEQEGEIEALDDDEESNEGNEAEEGSSSEEEDNNSEDDKKSNRHKRGRGRDRNRRGNKRSMMRRKKDELVDGDDGGKPFRFSLRNKYKIQEVIKRGQIMLIQVSKEERGNKGAAVTSYLSLPGRYCVLMPNSPRGGGVSRKIGNFKDRKRMREILKELTIPDGMSVILRTAGVSRTKAEIKRDLDYLMRLWNTIREDTLQSSAPALINEEGNLIKRSIRDLYARDIDEVLVSGESGYKTAKDFMKMLVPSHAKKVVEYNEPKLPLFHKYKVEQQISDIGVMTVTLKSGGYLVINPTEALVSVDVNSGKATKERHIEETALKTNLEAASEVARQLRLRDLGGLVVIDFIDMEERRNNRKVENRLRDALSNDRARIQVGRISSFGLLELSRQRLNPSLTEAQFDKCPHCEGSGHIKSLDFAAITALRALIEEGIKGKVAEMALNLPNSVAVYIQKNKHQMLADIEEMYDFRVHTKTDDSLKASEFRLDVIKKRNSTNSRADDVAEDKNKFKGTNTNASARNAEEESSEKPKKSRRRGRRGGRRHNKNRQNEEGNNNDDGQNNVNAPDKAEEVKSDKAVKKQQPPKKSSQAASDDKSNDNKKDEKPNNKPQEVQKAPKPSNDVKAPKENVAKEYEVVNEPPKTKKKGWWNKLIE